jgi:N,N'-diacetylbacillosaminyl-diphospho-undecaprenol alpha-1,3-N-acetylgalactosaminyltransferase
MNFYLISNSYKSFYLFRKEIIFELSKKYNVILIANNDEYYEYFNNHYKCVKLKNVFNNSSLLINFLFILKLIFVFFREKPSFVQTYTIHPNLLCIPIAKIFFAKTSAMITGMGATSITKNKLLKFFLNMVYKISFFFCDHIIFVNENNKKYFEKELNIKKKNTKIFGAGVSLKKYNKKQIFFEKKYNLKSSFNILFLGRLIKEKGVLDAIKMFKLLNVKNKKLIFIGGFDLTSFSKIIDYKIFNYPGIILTGHIKDPYQIYLKSDIFILPSYTEGMPTTLMEAIRFGVPTVSYKIAGVEDIIINDLNGGLVKTGDYIGMLKKIKQIKNNSNYKRNLIQNGNKLSKKFDRKYSIKKIINAYNNNF